MSEDLKELKKEESRNESNISALDLLKQRSDLFDLVLENIPTAKSEERKVLVSRIFEHSSEDGFLLADKLHFGTEEIVDVLSDPKFVLKHQEYIDVLKRVVNRDRKYIDNGNKELVEKINASEVGEIGKEGVLKESIQGAMSKETKDVYKTIDIYYENFLKRRTFGNLKETGETSLGFSKETFMRSLDRAVNPAYYSDGVKKVLRKELPEEEIEVTSGLLTKEEVEEISEKTGVSMDRFKGGRRIENSVVYEVSKGKYKKDIKENLEASLKMRIGKDDVSLVQNTEGLFEVKFKEEGEEKESVNLEEVEGVVIDLIDELAVYGGIFYSRIVSKHITSLAPTHPDIAIKIMNEIKGEDSSAASDIAEALAPTHPDIAIKIMNEVKGENSYSASRIAEALAPTHPNIAIKIMNEVKGDNSYSASRIAEALAPTHPDIAIKIMNEVKGDNSYSATKIAAALAPTHPNIAIDLMNEVKGDKSAVSPLIAAALAPTHPNIAIDLMNEVKERDPDGIFEAIIVAAALAPTHPDIAIKIMNEVKKKSSSEASKIAAALAPTHPDIAIKIMNEVKKKSSNSASVIAAALAPTHPNIAIDLMNEIKGENSDATLLIATTLLNHFSNQENKSKELLEIEKEFLETLNFLEGDESNLKELLNKWLLEREEEEEPLSYLKGISEGFNRVIKKAPSVLSSYISSKIDNTSSWKIQSHVNRLFPEIEHNKEKEESERKNNSWIKNFFGESGFEREDSSASKNPLNYLSDSSSFELVGGDPLAEGNDTEVLNFRDKQTGFLITDTYFSYNTGNKRWDRVVVPTEIDLDGPIEEITATVPNIENFSGRMNLPIFFGARVEKNRVVAKTSSGEEIKLECEIDITGKSTVDVPKGKDIESILYSQTKSLIPAIPSDISKKELDIFNRKLTNILGEKYFSITNEISSLPDEINIFIEEIKDLKPKEKLISIEKFVREISYYDFDNGEIKSEKRGRTPDELLGIMEMRMVELKKRKPELKEELSGKKYAGVCTDFSLLTTAILRKSNFVSGIATGFSISGKTATVGDAHALSTVLWPKDNGAFEHIQLDGTPSGVTDEEKAKLRNLQGPSLSEKEEIREKEVDKMLEEVDKKMKEIDKIIEDDNLDELRKLTNGELESMLNSLLKYKVKNNHVDELEFIFSAATYSPAIKEVLSGDIEDLKTFEEFITKEFSNYKNHKSRYLKKEQAITEMPAGKKLMTMISHFTDSYEKKIGDRDEAYVILERIIESSGKILSKFEEKVTHLAINYLKSKNMTK